MKRILTVQDISCVGQCSLTVALPVLSVCGHETCVLPSAVLSTHSGGFSGFTFRDLTEDIPPIWKHWKKEGLTFDAVYTGYLGSQKQMDYLTELFREVLVPEGKIIIDPAMADHGRLYHGFDAAFARAMGDYARQAHLLLPNLTESYLLTGLPYREDPSDGEIRELLLRLHDLSGGSVVITGAGEHSSETGFSLCENGEMRFYRCQKLPGSYHGTGDLFASALVGAWLGGKPLYDAGVIASSFVCRAIETTKDYPEHTYGVRFEPVLGELAAMVQPYSK